MKTRTIELDYAERRVVCILVNQILQSDVQKTYMDDHRRQSIMDILDAEEVDEFFNSIPADASKEDRKGDTNSYEFRYGQYVFIRKRLDDGFTAGFIPSEVISTRESFDLKAPTDDDMWAEFEEEEEEEDEPTNHKGVEDGAELITPEAHR
jgi:hypothetical protein